MTQQSFPDASSGSDPANALATALAETQALAAESLVVVIAAPSGCGKTTLCQNLLAEDPRLTPALSATTRAPRSGEIDGVDYCFVDDHDFARIEREDGFLETAIVHANRYGVLRARVDEAIRQGRDVLVDCDWQGRRRLAELYGSRLVSIFILPPSLSELRGRLQGRGKDDAATIERRLAAALGEIAHWREFDHVLVNDDLARVSRALRAILTTARTSVARAASAR